jgi:hypothetical protein
MVASSNSLLNEQAMEAKQCECWEPVTRHGTTEHQNADVKPYKPSAQPSATSADNMSRVVRACMLAQRSSHGMLTRCTNTHMLTLSTAAHE